MIYNPWKRLNLNDVAWIYMRQECQPLHTCLLASFIWHSLSVFDSSVSLFISTLIFSSQFIRIDAFRWYRRTLTYTVTSIKFVYEEMRKSIYNFVNWHLFSEWVKANLIQCTLCTLQITCAPHYESWIEERERETNKSKYTTQKMNVCEFVIK